MFVFQQSFKSGASGGGAALKPEAKEKLGFSSNVGSEKYAQFIAEVEPYLPKINKNWKALLGTLGTDFSGFGTLAPDQNGRFDELYSLFYAKDQKFIDSLKQGYIKMISGVAANLGITLADGVAELFANKLVEIDILKVSYTLLGKSKTEAESIMEMMNVDFDMNKFMLEKVISGPDAKEIKPGKITENRILGMFAKYLDIPPEKIKEIRGNLKKSSAKDVFVARFGKAASTYVEQVLAPGINTVLAASTGQELQESAGWGFTLNTVQQMRDKQTVDADQERRKWAEEQVQKNKKK